MNAQQVQERIESAARRLQVDYSRCGGWRSEYAGYLDVDDPAFPGYVGSFAWSEADIQHRFANLLHDEFGELEADGDSAVHLELPIREGTRSDLDPVVAPARRRVQHIDIVVTDPRHLRGVPADQPSGIGHAFRGQQHLAFIEVKWFHKGSTRWTRHNWNAKVIKGVEPDVDRLAEHVARGRCLVGAMLLVDDTGAYGERYSELKWPEEVIRLALEPR